MAVTRNAAACPLPQVSTTLRLLSDAYASSSGTAPASRSFVQGESVNLRPKLNENALRLDLSSRFGGGVRAVAQGLAVTAAGLVGTVAAGQCLIDGIAEIPASVTDLSMLDNTWNYFWVQQAPGGTASVVVTQSTTAPSNSVFIGAVQVTGGVAGTPDTSGVLYARGGLRLRETADTGAPGDTPPAACMLFTKTAGGLYLWDGAAHQFAGTAAIYAQTLAYSVSESVTPLDTTGASPGDVLTVPATPGDPPEWTAPGAGSGTVTSVGLTVPTGLSVSGSPVTNSGTLAVTLGVSGLLKGSAGAIVAATAGTDYLAPNGNGSALTNLSGSAVASGTVAAARLPTATTTASGIVELATDGETSSGVVVQGNDARLSNARTPTGTAGGDLSGTYPNPTVDGLQGVAVHNAAPSDGDVLTYSVANSRWEPAAPTGGGGGGATDLDDLTDVVITSASSGEFLRHNGTNWVDATIQAGDIPSGVDAAKIGGGGVSNTEFGYLDGVTSAIQTQIDGKAASSHVHSAAAITSGELDLARLPDIPVSKLDATGTPDSTTYLCGNGTWATPSGGGSGDIPFLSFNPEQARLPASNPAASATRNAHALLAFDDSTQEYAIFAGVLPTAAFPTTDDIRVRIIWVAASATSGDVVWRVNWERRENGTFGNVDTDAWGVNFNGTATAANGTNGIRSVTDIVCDGGTSGSQAPGPGQQFRLRISRVASDGSDTMTGDAQILAVLLEAI